MFVDSHIHLSHDLFDDEAPCIENVNGKLIVTHYNRQRLIYQMKCNGIEFVIEPAIDFDSNEELLSLNKAYPDFLYPAVGIHPTRSPHTSWNKRRELTDLASDENVIAIGELGLDYHHPRKEQHRFRQLIWFMWQLELAHKNNLPLILHIRQADLDAIKVLNLFKHKLHGGVCHCFNSEPEIAKIYTEKFGFMLGIGGMLLTNNCPQLEQTVREIPLQYLLLETDGPYVKPEKPDIYSEKTWKKSRNNSLIIPLIAERIGQIKNIPPEKVEAVTRENVHRLFGV